MEILPCSFITESLDGLSPACTARRIEAEDDAYQRRDAEGEDHRHERDLRLHAGEPRHQQGDQPPEKNADSSAREREKHGLDEELQTECRASWPR